MQYQLEVEDKDAYLASTHYIDWQNPMILAKAEELFADCGTELEKIKAAFTARALNVNQRMGAKQDDGS